MSLAALALSAGLALSSQQADIAQRVASSGKPGCVAYDLDNNETPCLPAFEVTAGVHVNAWAVGERVRFSRAAVMRLTRDEFALLTAHEVAHYFLGHGKSTPEVELEADRLGAELACSAGFNPAAGISLLRYLASGPTHPPQELRRAVILSVPCRAASGETPRLASAQRPSPGMAP